MQRCKPTTTATPGTGGHSLMLPPPPPPPHPSSPTHQVHDAIEAARFQLAQSRLSRAEAALMLLQVYGSPRRIATRRQKAPSPRQPLACISSRQTPRRRACRRSGMGTNYARLARGLHPVADVQGVDRRSQGHSIYVHGPNKQGTGTHGACLKKGCSEIGPAAAWSAASAAQRRRMSANP